MTKIKTKEYVISKQHMWHTQFHTFMKQGWWVFFAAAVFSGVFCHLVVLDEDKVAWIIGTFVFICGWIGAYALLAYGTAHNPKNKIWYVPQIVEVDGEGITVTSSDRYSSSVKLHMLLFARKLFGCYHIFVAASQAFYVPFDAFYSEEDRQQFEAILRQYNLL